MSAALTLPETRRTHEMQTETLPQAPHLLDVRAVAAMLGCSPRHIYRCADAQKIPRPVHVGALVRWNRATLEKWIADGRPNVRSAKGAA